MTEQYPSPVLSVIVPVYKVEKYLETCVRSLLDQRWKDLEVILVDDGSPDGCPDLCEAFAAADPRVRVVHKENAGLGLARNSGLDVASGEYVTFVDSDDYVDTETFSSLLERHSLFDPDVIYYRYGRFTDTTRGRTVHSETERAVKPLNSGFTARLVRTGHFLPRASFFSFSFSGGTSAFHFPVRSLICLHSSRAADNA